MMNILAMDTSSTKLSLAVARNGTVLTYRNFPANKSLSTSIIANIDKVLNNVHLSLDKIDGFAVGLGPGSFTGLRVGLATLKGLAFANNKPVIGISSLDIIANGIKSSDKDQHICVITDARRNLVYWAVFKKVNGQLTKVVPYRLGSIDQVCQEITYDVIFVGDAVKIYKSQILSQKKDKISFQFAQEKYQYPQARLMIESVIQKFREKKTDVAENLIPIYLYPEDCQVRKNV